MESKVIMFLVFASLAQSSNVPMLRASDKLSKHQLAVLDKITANEKASIIASSEILEITFDIIDELAAKLIWSLEAKTGYYSEISKARVKNQHALDLFLDSIPIALEKSSSCVKLARITIHHQVDNLYALMATVLKLAQSGNSGGNRDAIKVHEAKADKIVTNIIGIFYNLIRTQLNTTDTDTLAVIKSAEDGSRASICHVNNAVFNAINYYSTAVTVGYADESLIHDIEDCRGKAIRGSVANIQYRYDLLQTLYIFSKINQRGIVTALAINQHSLTVSADKFKEGNGAFFNTARAYCLRVDLGLGEDGDDDFSPSDAALATAIAKFQAGDKIILDAFQAMHPNSTLIDPTRKVINTIVAEGLSFYFDTLHLALIQCGNYSETVDKIRLNKNIAVSSAPPYTQLFFNLLRDNRTFDDTREAEIKTLQANATYGAAINTAAFFDAAEILAKVIHTCEVKKDACSAIQDLLVIANIGVDYFCKGIFAAALIVLQAITPS